MSRQPRNCLLQEQVGSRTPVASDPFSSSRFIELLSDGVGSKQGTESIHSDEPNPTSTTLFLPRTPKFNLEKTFPSIKHPIKHFRRAAEHNDLEQMQAPATILVASLKSIIDSMNRLPAEVRIESGFELAQCGALFTVTMFDAQFQRLDPLSVSGTDLVDRIQGVLELLEITIASFRTFMKIAQRIIASKKPLPALPSAEASTDEKETTSTTEPGQGETLAIILDDVLRSLNRQASLSTDSSSITSHSSASSMSNFVRSRKGSILRGILKRAGNLSKISLETSDSRTLADLAPNDYLKKDPELDRPTEKLYSPRLSMAYFPADPYAPEVDVDMPMPTGDAVAVRLDSYGELMAASLAAIIRILTSKEALTIPDFHETFFTSFRLFTTPTEVLDHLITRFKAEPDEMLNAAQMRVWTRETFHIRIRIAKILKLWMEEYWQPGTDTVVLESIYNFVIEYFIGKLPDQLVLRILEGINHILNVEGPRGRKTLRKLEIEKVHATLRESSPTGFVFNPTDQSNSSHMLLAFDSNPGREELARQLTVRSHSLFLSVDPQSAVEYWMQGTNDMVGEKIEAIISFERSVSLWITEFILHHTSAKERAKALGFCVDVAHCCVELRNFSSAYAIFSGVANPSVYRLKETIYEMASSHKEKFLSLERLFNLHSNQKAYRAALEASETPAVPLISTLIHDIMAAKVMPAKVGLLPHSEEKILVNFCAIRIMRKTLASMNVCQIPYKLRQDGTVQAWLDDQLRPFTVSANMEEELSQVFYARSRLREPKEVSSDRPISSVSRHAARQFAISTLMLDYVLVVSEGDPQETQDALDTDRVDGSIVTKDPKNHNKLSRLLTRIRDRPRLNLNKKSD